MLNNFFKKILKWFEEYQTKRARYLIQQNTYKELNSLTDAELNDIGISRGQIYEVSRSV